MASYVEYSISKVESWLDEIKHDDLCKRLAHLPAEVVENYYNISKTHEIVVEEMWYTEGTIHICKHCNSNPTDQNLDFIFCDTVPSEQLWFLSHQR